MAVEVRKYLGVGDRVADGVSGGVDQDGGNSQNEAARSARIHLLDGVANRAGYAVLIVGPLLWCAWCNGAIRDGDGIMAPFAMARELDALLGIQQIDVLEIPGGALCVGVSGLPPLRVDRLMAMAAILRGREIFGIDEAAGLGLYVRGQERLVSAKTVVIGT